MKKTSRLTYIALLAAQAVVISLFERSLPVPFVTPGAKLGLANIITCTALYTLKIKDVALVIFIRLLLVTMLGGNLSSFMYSLSGSVLSLIIMQLIKNIFKDKVSIIGVSTAGGVFHNIGQLLVASYIVQNIWVMTYLPILTMAGIATGIFVGITSNYMIKYIRKIPMFNKF